MKLLIVAFALASLPTLAMAQDVAPGGPIKPFPLAPAAKKDSTAQKAPTLPAIPQEEVPNPDQPAILVCSSPLRAATRQSPKVVRFLVADRASKTIAVSDQARGWVQYHRSQQISQFAKVDQCLDFVLKGTTVKGEATYAMLEVDLTKNTAILGDGTAVGTTPFTQCKTFEKDDYIHAGAWIRAQL